MFDRFDQARELGVVARDRFCEHANGADCGKAVLLAGCVLIGRRNARIAENVAFPGGGARLFTGRLRDSPERGSLGHQPPWACS